MRGGKEYVHISNSILISFVPLPLFLGLLAWLLMLVVLRLLKRSFSYLVVFSLFWLYLLLVTSATLFPIPLENQLTQNNASQSMYWTLSRVNLRPFFYGDFFHSSLILREMVANVLLTIPFGFSIRYLLRLHAIHIPFLAPAVGLSIEGTQLAISLLIGLAYRTVDINDVLLNASGVLIGYGLFRIFSWLILLLARWLGAPKKGFLAFLYLTAKDA